MGAPVITIVPGLGDGTFDTFHETQFSIPIKPYRILVTDLNGDGKQDLVVAETDYPTGGVYTAFGKGTARSTLAKSSTTAGPAPSL